METLFTYNGFTERWGTFKKYKISNVDKAKLRELTIQELQWRGCEIWIQNNHHTPGRKFIGRLGIGDLSGISKKGLRVEVELKTSGDTIKPAQRAFMKMIKERGGIALLATEENGKLVIKDFPTEIK